MLVISKSILSTAFTILATFATLSFSFTTILFAAHNGTLCKNTKLAAAPAIHNSIVVNNTYTRATTYTSNFDLSCKPIPNASDRVVFYHMPKVAGTYFTTEVRKQLNITRTWVVGHCGFTQFEQLEKAMHVKDPFKITFVREPGTYLYSIYT
jgi:hypothetical protein